MAEVFRAKTFGVEGFERMVAVKRILPNIAEDKEFIRMFVEEAKLAVQLNHANIAQITDLGVVDGSYYIAIEHVHGKDLRSVFERMRSMNEVMPVSHACYAVMKVCEGLDYAHNKRDPQGGELGLVHRDVSPQNVVVSFEGEVKLIDFGIAKAVGSTITTQSGILKGKIGYMSPEQVRGLPVDRRADVFSCGIVLYEMLTGERLFVGESDFSTLEKVRNVEIPPPTAYNSKIHPDLERIVLRALARDVSDRYQHAIDLHDDLQSFVYTAGEFCSRKDMAAWMKKVFVRELDEESAKLEAFRQGQAAPAPSAASGRPELRAVPRPTPATPSASPADMLADGRRTKAMGSPGSKPPPPPPARSQQIPTIDDGNTSSANLLALTPPGALPALPAAAPRPIPSPTPPPPPFASGGRSATNVGPAPTPAAAPSLAPAVAPIGQGAAGRPAAAMAGSSTFSGPAPVPALQVAASGPVSSAAPAAALAPVPQLPPSQVLPLPAGGGNDDDELSEWDDDEEDLETQIYDNDFPESEPVPKQAARPLKAKRPAATKSATHGTAPRPAQRPVSGQTGPGSGQSQGHSVSQTLPAAARPGTRPEPSSAARPGTRPEPSRAGSLPSASRQMAVPEAAIREASRVAPVPSAPSGAVRRTESVAAPPPAPPSVAIPQLPPRPASASAFASADPAMLSRESDPLIGFGRGDSQPFGRGLIGRQAPRQRSWLWLVLGGAILVVGGVALALTVGGGRRSSTNTPVVSTDEHTGFDLYVVPAGITRWRLDGELRTDRLPSRIRGIAPGPHAVVIEAPPGFMSQSQSVVVESGQAQKVVIELPVMEITGFFRSDPDGANVTIIADGERKSLGATPATFKLDPRKAYQVLFEKPGFVSANRPITFSGLERESIMVVLEKADGSAVPMNGNGGNGGSAGTTPTAPKHPVPAVTPTAPKNPVTAPKQPTPKQPTPKQPAEPTAPANAGGQGTLQVGAKPPCEILIDGKATGLSTPQRDIPLSAGSHRITLVNQEYGITESFTVDIKPDAPAKLVKDFSDRLPQ